MASSSINLAFLSGGNRALAFVRCLFVGTQTNAFVPNRHGTCPACKEKAKSARFSFQLNSILEYHRAVKKRQAGKTELVSKSESLPHTSEEIYPLSNSNDGYDSDSGSEPDYEIEAPRPAIAPIHDGVMWPCRSCSANNDTGYQCPHPIPNPSTDDGSADPISRPTRGDARLSLVDTTTMQFRSSVPLMTS